MKRKILAILLSLACIFCLVFGLTACKDADGDNKNNTEQGDITKPDIKWEGGWTLERAYAVAVDLGYDSSLEEFLETIKGKDGVDGQNGKDGKGIKSIRINSNGELVITLTDDLEINCGVVTGEKGDKGDIGADGKSAYEIWLDNGHEGTEEDFLNWLKGENGKDGEGFTPCNHAYLQWQVMLEPTCTSIGYNVRECIICGGVEYQFSAAIGHTVEKYIRSDSYTHVYICVSCGLVVEGRHIWNDDGDCDCSQQTIITVTVLYEDGTPIDGTKHSSGESWIMDNMSMPALCAQVRFGAVLADGTLVAVTNPVNIGEDGKATIELANILALATISNTVELHILNVQGYGYDKGEGNALYGRFEITEITEIPTEIIVTLQLAK